MGQDPGKSRKDSGLQPGRKGGPERPGVQGLRAESMPLALAGRAGPRGLARTSRGQPSPLRLLGAASKLSEGQRREAPLGSDPGGPQPWPRARGAPTTFAERNCHRNPKPRTEVFASGDQSAALWRRRQGSSGPEGGSLVCAGFREDEPPGLGPSQHLPGGARRELVPRLSEDRPSPGAGRSAVQEEGPRDSRCPGVWPATGGPAGL